MRLKYVTLKGFKVYKDETRVEFHRGSNAVTGLNGSGKSSLLEAITLVVSEIYGRKIDSRNVFHKGARNQALSAFIELCFDNSDRKLQLYDSDEVRIRRSFFSGGSKKDEFTVQGRKVAKNEFAGVLEHGGFSKSNPYYVVRQGKIMEVALMSDEGRLKMLKDFAGIQVYESKRAAAEQILQQCEEQARDQDVILEMISSKLQDLEAQQAELRRYNALVKSTTQLKVTILAIEGAELEAQQAQVNDALIAAAEEERRLEEKLPDLAGPLERVEVNVAEWKEKAREARLLKESQVAVVQLARRQVAELKSEWEKAQQTQKSTQQKRQQFTTQLEQAENELSGVLESQSIQAANQETQLVDEVQRLDQEYASCIQELQQLNAKAERCSSCTSLAERNKSLETQIRSKEKDIKSKKRELELLKGQTETVVSQLAAVEAQLVSQPGSQAAVEDQAKHAMEELVQEMNRLDQTSLQLRERHSQLQAGMRQRARMDAAMDVMCSASRNASWHANLIAIDWDRNREAYTAFGGHSSRQYRRDDVQLLEGIFRQVNEWRDTNPKVDPTQMDHRQARMPAVLGPVWALVDLNRKWSNAFTQAISNQIDHLVVWSDAVSHEVRDLLQRYSQSHRGGGTMTVTLAPLNQITIRQRNFSAPTYPPGVSRLLPGEQPDFTSGRHQAVPLIDVLGVPEFLRPILANSVGKFLLVPNLATGRRFARESNFDCVTPDGDKITHKGSLCGGFQNPVNLMTAAADFRDAIAEATTRAEEMARVAQEIDKALHQKDQMMKSQQELRQQLEQAWQAETQRESQLGAARKLQEVLQRKLATLQRQSTNAEEAVAHQQQGIADFRRLLLSNELEVLSTDERKRISALAKQQPQVQQQVEDKRRQLADVRRVLKNNQVRRQTLSSEINKLRKQLSRLEDELTVTMSQHEDETDAKDKTASSPLSKGGVHVRRFRAAKERCDQETSTLESLASSVSQAERQLKRFEEEAVAISKEMEAHRLKLSEVATAREAKEMEQRELSDKMARHEEELVTCVGLDVQDPEIEMLKKQSLRWLKQRLAAEERKLADAPRVNQRALDELMSYHEQARISTASRAEIQEALAATRELMVRLDQNRSKTLRESFDQVNRNLGEVFSEVVQNGRAKLVIKRLSNEKIEELRRAKLTGSTAQSLSSKSPPSAQSQISGSGESQAWRLQIHDPNAPHIAADPDDILHWDEVTAGIEIKASFARNDNGGREVQHTEYFPIVALSGGQKTILALSLIFAMQRCDKAPFYILDEADAALDEAYRSKVAQLIKRSATESQSQFIITTFRRELASVCDKHFHVINENRESKIHECSMEEALEVILENAHRATAMGLEDATELVPPAAIDDAMDTGVTVAY